MNWLRKLLGRATGAEPSPVVDAGTSRPEPVKALRPVRDMTRGKAARISTESVLSYCERLEREADRTGNSRLRQQARNIRARHAA